MDYKIEIIPDEKAGWYYWAILKLHFDKWVNAGHGLCKTVEEACEQAIAYYDTYYKNKEI